MNRIPLSLLAAVSATGMYCASVSAQEPAVEDAGSKMSAEQNTELAGLMLKMKKLPEARQAAAAALAADAGNREAMLIAGRVALLQQKNEEALSLAGRLLAAQADDTTARLMKGTALAGLGRNEEAVPCFEGVAEQELSKWREEFPLTASSEVLPTGLKAVPVEDTTESPVDREMEQARRVLEAKDYVQADQLTAALVQKFPESIDAALLRADLLSETNQHVSAISVLESARLQFKGPGPFPGSAALAGAMAEAGRAEDAMSLYRAIAADAGFGIPERHAAAAAAQTLHCSTLLADGEKALDTGDVRKADTISSQLVTITPQCPDALTLRARTLKANNRPEDAVRIFTVLKSKADGGKFDPQVDYAASLAAACRYRDAVRAYQEITARPGIYSAEEVTSAGEEIRNITEDNGGRFLTEFTGASLDEGKLERTTVSLSLPRMGQTRIVGGLLWDNITLEEGIYPAEMQEDRYTAYVGFEQKLSSSIRLTLLGGGTGDAALGSAALQWDCRDGTCLTLRAAWNDPAHDTLLLEALDGRQHVFSANLHHKLSSRWYLDLTGMGRIVELDGESFGSGFKGQGQLRFQPLEKNEDFWFAYEAQYATFSDNEHCWRRVVGAFFEGQGSDLSSQDAILPMVNRHAVQVHVGTDLGKQLTVALTGEVAYRQEVRETELGAIAEAYWHLSPNADLNVRMEYYTGGAGPNSGSSVLVGTAGLKLTW